MVEVDKWRTQSVMAMDVVVYRHVLGRVVQALKVSLSQENEDHLWVKSTTSSAKLATTSVQQINNPFFFHPFSSLPLSENFRRTSFW